jgi:divalent metal cation (Fe/Co/Zn/Cd) transporter
MTSPARRLLDLLLDALTILAVLAAVLVVALGLPQLLDLIGRIKP